MGVLGTPETVCWEIFLARPAPWIREIFWHTRVRVPEPAALGRHGRFSDRVHHMRFFPWKVRASPDRVNFPKVDPIISALARSGFLYAPISTASATDRDLTKHSEVWYNIIRKEGKKNLRVFHALATERAFGVVAGWWSQNLRHAPNNPAYPIGPWQILKNVI